MKTQGKILLLILVLLMALALTACGERQAAEPTPE